MKEFQLIREIQRLSPKHDAEAGVELGIGDDAAVLQLPAGQQLVAATDTLNQGTHFPVDTPAFDIGHKCLAVNLSDLAAMGATPHWALLSLSLPFSDESWLHAFMDGFNALAKPHGLVLVGGDTTRGPMSISVTALGSIETGGQITRSGARPGDLLVVSGSVGGAAYALERLEKGQVAPERELLDRPQPRVALGRLLRGRANACIDISDGLLADLGHVLEQSECGAIVYPEKLPCSESLANLPAEQRWRYQLSGGDDYELLFTLPPALQEGISAWRRQLGLNLTVIGEIVAGRGVRCIGPDGAEIRPGEAGYEHFREPV